MAVNIHTQKYEENIWQGEHMKLDSR